jgi:pimeloyl-ACP methyl ester carboxylesterase
MASRVRCARLDLVPHCGHMSPMEQPAAVAAALLAWLHEAP